MVVITVPFSEIEAPTLTVDQPAEGRRSRTGRSPSRARRRTRRRSRISRDLRRPGRPARPRRAPSRRRAPAGPPAPAPITVPVGDDGAWDTGASPLQLTTGTLDDHRHRLERDGEDDRR